MDIETASADAGTLALSVTYSGLRNYEGRQVWLFKVKDTAKRGRVWKGEELQTGVNATASARTMLGVLCGFLSYYGDHYRSNMAADPDMDAPDWIQESCYMNCEDLEILAYELSERELPES